MPGPWDSAIYFITSKSVSTMVGVWENNQRLSLFFVLITAHWYSSFDSVDNINGDNAYMCFLSTLYLIYKSCLILNFLSKFYISYKYDSTLQHEIVIHIKNIYEIISCVYKEKGLYIKWLKHENYYCVW